MSAYLLVSLQCCRSFEHVHSLEDCICSISFPDLQHRSRELPVSFQSFIIHKHVHLIHSHVLCHIHSANAKTAVEQAMVRFFIKLPHHRSRNELQVVGERPQLHRSVAVFRMKTAVKVERDGSFIVRTGFQTLVVVGYPPGAAPGHQVLCKHRPDPSPGRSIPRRRYPRGSRGRSSRRRR